LDQFRTALHQYLDADVVGDGVVLDDLADEVEVGLAGGGETDLDLLEAHADQQVEELALARGRHRVDQCLVAVPQVDRAPQRGSFDALVRPGAIGQRDVLDQAVPGTVPVERHGTATLEVPRSEERRVGNKCRSRGSRGEYSNR